jgi:membrane protein DedA with SNARE-associated domain
MLSSIGLALLTNVKKYGYFAVFFGVMLENAGLPVPGETLLITASGFASHGKLSIWVVAVIAAVAAIIGDNIGFSIGRFGGRPVIEKYGRYVFIRQQQLDHVDRFFARYGSVAVFLARFIAGARVLTALIAGTSDMMWPEFLLFNALGALVWASAISALGYYGMHFGKELLPYIKSLDIDVYYIAGAIAVIWLVTHIAWARARSKRRRAQLAETVPSEEG